MSDVDLYLSELFVATMPDDDAGVGVDYIEHYGKGHDENPPGRGSGRYPWGSGDRTNQHQWDLYTRIRKYQALNPNMPESQVAAYFGFYQTDHQGNYILDENGNRKGNTSAFRAAKQIATNTVKNDKFQEVMWYDTHTNPDTGKPYTNAEIAKFMGEPNESSIRSIRKTGQNGNQNRATEVADKLKEACAEKGYIDVGRGTELNLGTSQDGLKTSLEMLKQQGYTIKTMQVKQVSASNGQVTILKVLCPPGKDGSELYKNPTLIKTVDDPDGIESSLRTVGLDSPPQVSLDRIKINYAEDGGTKRDGMIEIRAVKDKNGNLVAANPDLSLGNAKYAQVRIAVEGNRYIKGMAVYNEDITSDIVVNSNKSKAKGVDGALKKMDLTKSNPFGAQVVQTVVRDENGKPVYQKDSKGNLILDELGHPKQVPSAINIVGSTPDDMHREGVWGQWSKNLPAQFLAKQNLPLVKQQLKLQSQKTEDDLNDIRHLNNPTVKRKMLIDFADQCDAAAVDLKAAPIGGQKTHVLLPVTTLKDNEIYAPNYPNGTQVALVRFPHAGPFEIPICTVNNNNREARSFMKNATDAVGINQHTASKLSGADFDGDTAIVIPLTRKNSNGEFEMVNNIKSAPSLIGKAYDPSTGKLTSVHVQDFDPTAYYSTDNPRFSSMKKMGEDGKYHPTYKYFKTDKDKGREMGVISNLITDMYAKGCSDEDELARADMYSMVVIDAKKHELNYKQAYKDFGIQELKDKYQVNADGSHGVSSLLSRSKSPTKVDSRAIWTGYGTDEIDPKTGEKLYKVPKHNAEKQTGYWERVKAPSDYKWVDPDGKSHRSTYMKDPKTGKDLIASTKGEIVQNKDGSYTYKRNGGKDVWVQTGTTRRQEEVPLMSTVKDARELLSNNPNEIEQAYAVYANHMKSLANEARKESLSVKPLKYSPEAKKTYAKEVKELDDALVKAKKNAPRERQAQLLATSKINAELDKHPEYESDDRRKLRGQALNQARKETGASKDRIEFTPKQWEAINAGAISESKLNQLLSNADKDSYVRLALPKKDAISTSKKSTARSLYNAGWTQEQIAEFLGISQTSVSGIVNE